MFKLSMNASETSHSLLHKRQKPLWFCRGWMRRICLCHIKHHATLLLSLTFALLLSSCATPVKKDGPPEFYVDETRIPNAVPKREPLAKSGNMKTYTVFGKRYHVISSSRHYNEIGIASWYGTKFHARKTSSGEPYDMLGMTAAHKTLPLPTYVEVTNLVNGRKVIVKVNDRGPFAPHRIIDLSYVAAKKLGMLGHGTTRVRVKAINPYTYHKAIHHAQGSTWRRGGGIYFQLGAFKVRDYAQALKDRMTGVITEPVLILNPRHHVGFYRVRLGPIQDRHRADLILKRLDALGIKAKQVSA